jgi:hypothetical protein
MSDGVDRNLLWEFVAGRSFELPPHIAKLLAALV